MDLAEINNSKPLKTKSSIRGFWQGIVYDKFDHPIVPILLLAVSLLLAVMISNGKSGIMAVVLFMIMVIVIPIVYGVVAYPKFGILILFIAAYLLFIPLKMDTHGFPLGTVMDGLEALLILGFFIKQKIDNRWSIYNNALSWWLLVWIGYNFWEVVNPESISSLAWMYTIRTTAIVIFMYHVFVYQIREVSYIKLIFKVWLILAFIGALDGIKQEYFGYFNSESNYLYSDPVKVALLFIDGHMRKFSIFSDPVAFAYNMCSAGMVCIVFMFAPIKTYKKYMLGGLLLFLMTSMLYSGTRGAFPLIPAALVLFGILNFNKKILIFSLVATVMFSVLIFVPSNNPSIQRFQTAFKPNNDPSFNLRKMNQARIRPFILSHPIGGGLGSTGMWGHRFAPYSMLANFPPDSGYVRVAVELGIVGILILCIVMFVALYTGINNHFLIRDPIIKSCNLVATLVVFVYNVGNYPQEAIVQFPSNIIFFLCMALIPICLRIDREKQKLAAQ